MAGRYVVIEFDDADAANMFAINENISGQLGYSVKAMFVRPSKFCDCSTKKRQNVANWTKGKTTGLYLCNICKKPSAHHQTGMMSRLQYVFGFNLLDNKKYRKSHGL